MAPLRVTALPGVAAMRCDNEHGEHGVKFGPANEAIENGQ